MNARERTANERDDGDGGGGDCALAIVYRAARSAQITKIRGGARARAACARQHKLDLRMRQRLARPLARTRARARATVDDDRR